MDKSVLSKRGQTVLEYAIILGIVALALGTMQIYLKRGIQAGIKIAADEIGLQRDSVDLALELDPAKEVEFLKEAETASIIKQEAQLRQGSSATHQIVYGESGRQSVIVNNKIGVLNVDTGTPSYSKYWSNWKKQEEEEGLEPGPIYVSPHFKTEGEK